MTEVRRREAILCINGRVRDSVVMRFQNHLFERFSLCGGGFSSLGCPPLSNDEIGFKLFRGDWRWLADRVRFYS